MYKVMSVTVSEVTLTRLDHPGAEDVLLHSGETFLGKYFSSDDFDLRILEVIFELILRPWTSTEDRRYQLI